MPLDHSVDIIGEQCGFTKGLLETLAIISKDYHVSAVYYQEPWKAPEAGVVGIIITDYRGVSQKRFNCDVAPDESTRINNFYELTNRLKDWYASEGVGHGTIEIKRIRPTFPELKPLTKSEIDSILSTTLNTAADMAAPNIIIDEISKEIRTRGDFELDIPKLVDVLFKLGCIKSKED